MKTVLDDILEKRRADIETARQTIPEFRLQARAATRIHHSLSDRLRNHKPPRIIAEIKQRSPSAGLLLEPYLPTAVAADYEYFGAAAISVLTEPHFFGGCGEDLAAVRNRVQLPILCKDFLIDSYQIVQAAAWGADVVLLIAAALDPATCLALYQTAIDLGLEVIVEVHSEPELEVALRCPHSIIGVNNRDLRTLATRMDTARKIAPQIPSTRLSIAESGLKSAADLQEAGALGFDGFLIGESLLRGGNPGAALERLLREAGGRE